MTDIPFTAPSPTLPRAAVNTGAGLWVSSLTVAGRMLRKFARTPQLIAFTAIQSALFLLMFRFAFGGAIRTGGSLSYVNFLVPGFIATTVLWSGMGAATGVAEDLDHGTGYYVGLSLAWAAAIFVVFGILAVVRFARR